MVVVLVTLVAAVAVAVILRPEFVTGARNGWGSRDVHGSQGPGTVMSSRVGPGQRDGSVDARARWAAVLRQLDARRDRAWRTGRPGRLGQVFLSRTAPWYADRAALRGYLARGYTVTGTRMRFWDVEVLSRTAYTVMLRVADRLSQVSVRGRDGALSRLPHDRPTRHVLTLRLAPDGWRISAIRAV